MACLLQGPTLCVIDRNVTVNCCHGCLAGRPWVDGRQGDDGGGFLPRCRYIYPPGEVGFLPKMWVFPSKQWLFPTLSYLVCPILEELNTMTRSGQVLSQFSLPSPSSRWVEVWLEMCAGESPKIEPTGQNADRAYTNGHGKQHTLYLR